MTSSTVGLSAAQALALRMAGLLLAGSDGGAGVPARPADVAGVVEWFGAMQAQDLASGLWSLGARLPGHRLVDVQAALERAETLRTWPMRGTVHLVPPRDAAWMVELMGARVLPTLARRREQLGLSDTVTDQACDTLEHALAGGRRLTRDEALQTLRDKGIDTQGQRGYHLLGYAAHRGVICFGPPSGKQQTFVLLREWAPDPVRPGSRDEALATMAERYFRSHGPTTMKDFAGWTGLTLADCRRGVAAAGERIATARLGDVEVHLDPRLLATADTALERAAGVRVLAGFDEYLLGYKDRSLMLAAEHLQAIVPGGNGVFQPTVVRDGRVVGTWRRTTTTGRLTVDVLPLVALAAKDRNAVEAALQPYAVFHDLPLTVRWPT